MVSETNQEKDDGNNVQDSCPLHHAVWYQDLGSPSHPYQVPARLHHEVRVGHSGSDKVG